MTRHNRRKLIELGTDQTSRGIDEINSKIADMSLKLEDLSTLVQCVKEELQTFQEDKYPDDFSDVYTPRSFDPADLPVFPKQYADVHVFRKWIRDVGDAFEFCELSGEEEAKHVATTFPRWWWVTIQKLNNQVGENNPITFSEMKKMFMATFFSDGDSLLTKPSPLLVPEEAEDDVAAEAEDDVAEEAEDDVAAEAEDDVAEEAEDDVAAEAEDDVAEEAEDDVAAEAEDDVAEEAEDDVAAALAKQSVQITGAATPPIADRLYFKSSIPSSAPGFCSFCAGCQNWSYHCDAGKVIMDQTHSDLLIVVESMSNTIQGLQTCVQSMEVEWQKVEQAELKKVKEEYEADVEGFLSGKIVPINIPFSQANLPRFPEKNKIKEFAVFREWIKNVDLCFEHCRVTFEQEAKYVADTIPEDFLWWKQIRDLYEQNIQQNTEKNFIEYNEMKKMLMVLCFPQDESVSSS